MIKKWNLSRIYESFESSDIKNDMKDLRDIAAKLIQLGASLDSAEPKESIKSYVELTNNAENIAGKLFSYANLTSAVDTSSIAARKLQDNVRGITAEMTIPQVQFQNWIAGINDLEKILMQDEVLKDHAFAILEIRSQAEHSLSEEAEDILVRMRNVGSTAWTQLQNNVTSNLLVSVTVEDKLEKIPLSQARNLAFDRRRNVRKNAYESEIKAYSQIEEISAFAINAIKGEGLILAEKRGFKSPLDMTLFNSRLDEESLNSMMESVKDSLFYFEKYYKKKSKMLSNSGALPFYDLFAPVSADEKNYTYEEAHAFIVDNFAKFSKKLADFADNAFKNDWIDPFPKEGKRGGAFCSGIHAIKESRILSNFSGSFKNVTTLAHELGHAYHNFNLASESSMNSSFTMPIAETASIFCETIVINGAIKNASDSFKLSVLENSISSAAQVVVDIYSRFLFEKNLFERRKSGPLSVEELCSIMESSQKEAYGDGIDAKTLHGYMWINKPHYYYANSHFYNFPYTFGLLFAKGLYSEYLKRGEEFVPVFDELLKNTGRYSIPDLTLKYGINTKTRSFWDGSLSIIVKDIDAFCSI